MVMHFWRIQLIFANFFSHTTPPDEYFPLIKQCSAYSHTRRNIRAQTRVYRYRYILYDIYTYKRNIHRRQCCCTLFPHPRNLSSTGYSSPANLRFYRREIPTYHTKAPKTHEIIFFRNRNRRPL